THFRESYAAYYNHVNNIPPRPRGFATPFSRVSAATTRAASAALSSDIDRRRPEPRRRRAPSPPAKTKKTCGRLSTCLPEEDYDDAVKAIRPHVDEGGMSAPRHSCHLQGSPLMRAIWSSTILLSLAALAAPIAQAQTTVRARSLVLVDTSGSMVWHFGDCS